MTLLDVRDWFTCWRYRLTYCTRYGHLNKGWGYCANCGMDDPLPRRSPIHARRKEARGGA